MKYRNAKLILASGSPRRKQLLEMTGHLLEIRVSGADETTDEKDPARFVEELSKRKAFDVAADVENGIVLGADTVVASGGEILGKPADAEDAKRMLAGLSGRAHEVYTGVTLVCRENGSLKWAETFHEETKVFVLSLSTEEIDEYIATGEPLDKAGAYGIQGFFGKYIERIEGDYFNVVGLPLSAVYQVLRRREADEMQ